MDSGAERTLRPHDVPSYYTIHRCVDLVVGLPRPRQRRPLRLRSLSDARPAGLRNHEGLEISLPCLERWHQITL